MSEYEPLVNHAEQPEIVTKRRARTVRVVSLDVFHGLSVLLMWLVDYAYAGSVFPIIAHSPWNGVHLAYFVMPFFLFVSGVSIEFVYEVIDYCIRRSYPFFTILESFRQGKSYMEGNTEGIGTFSLWVPLQGGYLHGITSLTFGVDIERIRWLGILQRISIGYIVAALCEMWLPCQRWKGIGSFRNYSRHGYIAFSLSAIYVGYSKV